MIKNIINYISYVMITIKNIIWYVKHVMTQLGIIFRYLLGLKSSNKETKKKLNFYFKLILLLLLIICLSYLSLFSSIIYTN